MSERLPIEQGTPIPSPEFDGLSDADFRRSVVDLFHRLYYQEERRTWWNTYWLGAQLAKCPLDLWLYQEILFELRPDVVVETGTLYGGSASYIASLCDLIGNGRVYTVDIEERPYRPIHPRIEYLLGSSTSQDVLSYLRAHIRPDETTVVILDSDHAKDHVLEELRRYHQFVTPGSYLIVEDTNVNGHPVLPDYGPGPMEAVQEFLRDHDEFLVDSSREKFFLTFQPGGYLKRVKGGSLPQPDSVLNAEASPRDRFIPSSPALLRPRFTVETLHNEVALRDQTIEWLHREVAQRDQTIEWLHHEVAERDRTVRLLQGDAARSDALLTSNQTSRLWSIDTLYWSLRDRLRTAFGIGKSR